MSAPSRRNDRSAALFLLGVVLLNAPLLLIFNFDARLFGVPVLFLYLFAAWILLVALLGISIEGPDEAPGESGGEGS